VVWLVEPAAFFDALEGDGEGELRFLGQRGGDGAVVALHSPALALEGAEELREVHGAESFGEVVQGLLTDHLGFTMTEEAHVVAADLLSFEGDLAAELSGGEIVLAEGCVGHGLAPSTSLRTGRPGGLRVAAPVGRGDGGAVPGWTVLLCWIWFLDKRKGPLFGGPFRFLGSIFILPGWGNSTASVSIF
jgi:hypothetical protein